MIYGLNDRTLVRSARFCLIVKLSCNLICRYIVLYFLPKKSLLLLTNYEIKGLVVSHNGTNIHLLVPTSLNYPATNLYTSVVDLIYFRRSMELAL